MKNTNDTENEARYSSLNKTIQTDIHDPYEKNEHDIILQNRQLPLSKI